MNEILINDVDTRARTEEEWAEKYSIQLAGNDILSSDLMDEFEWAWYKQKLNYYPLESNGTYDKAETMEVRGDNILTDLLLNATPKERKILKQKYIQTEYVSNYRANH